jgi:hypothetical protein
VATRTRCGGHARPRRRAPCAASQPRAAAQDRHAGIAQQLLVDAVQAGDLARTVGLEQRPVETRLAGRPAEAARLLESIGEVRRVAVQLLRDAAQVDAGAAECAALGHRDTRATLRGHARGAHATAAGADDEQEGRQGFM